MRRLPTALRNHGHFIVVVTLLTLIMTWPTILNVFRTDVFWLPTGKSTDVFIKLWDVWYAGQFLSGQADRSHTNQIFYPEGVSLVYHPFFIPHAIVVNGLRALLPATNAFILTHLLIIWTAALSAYVYLRWLFKDQWAALLGAVVFGLSPVVVANANHTEVSFVAPIPLALYAFHRGIHARRRHYMVIAGLLAGLTSISSLYGYVCLALTLGFAAAAFATTAWRDPRFWQDAGLLIAVSFISSAPRLIALLGDAGGLDAALRWHGALEIRGDLISYFVNHNHPLIGPLGQAILKTPPEAGFSATSYIGYLPLLLIGIGLLNSATRRKMRPWLALWLFFVVLRLGSVLEVNGVVFSEIKLPKFYLNQLLPPLFAPFAEADIILMGAVLPLAVLCGYGCLALRRRLPKVKSRGLALALVLVVALEYYSPPQERLLRHAEYAFVDWLAAEEGADEIRLVYLPMGRSQSKRYNFMQTLSGHPHAEGTIARTPDSAYDFIRNNALLEAWHRGGALACAGARDRAYHGALDALIEVGFSHIVWHRYFGGREAREAIAGAFEEAAPAYQDDFVNIYRLRQLDASCPD